MLALIQPVIPQAVVVDDTAGSVDSADILHDSVHSATPPSFRFTVASATVACTTVAYATICFSV